MTTMNFSALSSDTVMDCYTVASSNRIGVAGKLKRPAGRAQMTRIINVLKRAADQNINSVKIENAPNGVIILSTNLEGTRYVASVQGK
jgi:hypothetical protein